MDGSLLTKEAPIDTVKFGAYTFTIKHDYTLGWSPGAKEDQWPQTGGLVIQTAPDEFIVAGTGIVISFSSDIDSEMFQYFSDCTWNYFCACFGINCFD